jgi:hypothetical protein
MKVLQGDSYLLVCGLFFFVEDFAFGEATAQDLVQVESIFPVLDWTQAPPTCL